MYNRIRIKKDIMTTNQQNQQNQQNNQNKLPERG